MLRKLALVGLVLVVGRGTVAQLSVAVTLSFCFVARRNPRKSSHVKVIHNRVSRFLTAR